MLVGCYTGSEKSDTRVTSALDAVAGLGISWDEYMAVETR
jgi:hypothetical protein